MAKFRPAQEFIPVKEIRDGVLILKDGSMRLVVMVSTMNFALKSQDEQLAIIQAFQNFLNSLDFSIQVLIQSRRLDIRPYIALLEGREKEQVGDLMRIQVREYIEFVKGFTESTNIMAKSFYVVIPYERISFKKEGSFAGKIAAGTSAGSRAGGTGSSDVDFFEENRMQLEQRLGIVESGISGMGLRIAALGTEEVIELLYHTLNPGEQEKPLQVAQ
ncbi:hypothetical protein L0Y49_00620 [bacterium]|nr:hypothetical protein [bacterium]MCI0565818.1 hypothetical protein [bacterium]MCI0680105.1 hypothetical protein [bacterium]